MVPAPEEELEAANALARVRQAMFGKGPGGIVMGRYQLEERLGGGGEGAVYAATDPELGRRVAVKLLSATGLPQRLLHEARTLASISHPNVVTVYDVGEYDLRRHGQGRGVFIVLELLEGDTLDGWLRAQRRSTDEVVTLMTAVGRGLAAVHAAGLVHRDVKPRNVLVDADGRVMLADFGIAEVVAPDRPDDDDGRSRDSGTPRYMAPEQRAGALPSERADQYSFCATFWTALYGQAPGAPDGPSHVDARRVPRSLRRVIARGLSEDPARRFPSMRALLVRIDRTRTRRRRIVVAVAVGVGLGLAGPTLLAPSAQCSDAEALLADTWAPVRANRIEAALARAGATKDDRRHTVENLDAYAEAWKSARTESCEGARAQDETRRRESAAHLRCLERARLEMRAAVDVLTDADEVVVASAAALTERLRAPGQCLDSAPGTGLPGAGFDREAAARLLRARLLTKTGRPHDALAQIEALDPRALIPWQRARWYANQALASAATGARAEAEAHYTRAHQLAVQAGDQDSAVRLLLDLAHLVAHEEARHAEARRLVMQAEAQIDAAKLGAELRASLALTQANLALEEEKPDAALVHLAALEAACTDAGCAGRAEHLLAAGRLSRGNVLLAKADHAGARKQFEQHLALVEGARGTIRRQAWMSMYNLGLVAEATGDLVEAGEWYESAEVASEGREWRVLYALARVAAERDDPHTAAGLLDQAEARLSAANPESGWALALHVSRARIAGLRGDHQVALRQLTHAHGEHVGVFGAEHRRTIDTLEELADAHAAAQEFESCLSLHRRVLRWRTRELPSHHPLRARSRHGVGRCLLATGEVADAVDELRNALAEWTRASGPRTPRQLDIEDDLARALLAAARPAEARQVVSDAIARLPETDAAPRHAAALWFTLAQADAALGRSSAAAAATTSQSLYRALGSRYTRDAELVTQWLDTLTTKHPTTRAG